jgi:hypothetical protein
VARAGAGPVIKLPHSTPDALRNACRQVPSRLEPGIAQQIGAQHRQRIKTPEYFSVHHERRNPEQAKHQRLLAVRLKLRLDGGVLERTGRRQPGGQGLQARRIGRVRATLPRMAEDRLADIAVRFTTGITGDGQAQQAKRVERVARRQLQRHAVHVGLPRDLAVGPVPLRCDFRGAQLPMVFEQGRKQHRFVRHPVADALQCLGQLFERQIGVGRDEVQIELDVFHGRVSWRAATRWPISVQTARLLLSGNVLQRAISSSVRRQPSHRPLTASMRQTEMHGEGTFSALPSAEWTLSAIFFNALTQQAPVDPRRPRARRSAPPDPADAA